MNLIDLTGTEFPNLTVLYRGEDIIKNNKKDNIKNNYCKLNNINLLRLPYTLSNAEIKEQIYEYHLSVTTTGCA